MDLIYTCSLCGSQNAEFFLRTFDRYSESNKTFNLYRCINCGLISISPLPVQETLSNVTVDHDVNPFFYFHNSHKEILDRLYSFFHPYLVKWRIKQIEKTVGTGRLLDVGCGNGTFIYELKQRLWDVTGVESNSKKAVFAKNTLGLNVLPNMESLLMKYNNYYDMITFWHSFGSISDFKKTLNQASKLLHPDGFLLIALSNWRSLDFWFYKNYWSALDAPRRFHHFAPRQIKFLLSQSGLVLEKTKVIPFDIYYNCLLSERIILGRERAWRSKRLFLYWRSLTLAFIAHIISISGAGSGMLYFIRKGNGLAQ